MLKLLPLLLLTGCASFIQDAQHANDTAIKGWTIAGCALPLSAILRNPEIIPALNTLCKPTNGANPEAVTK